MLTNKTLSYLFRAVRLTGIAKSQPYTRSTSGSEQVVEFLSSRRRYLAFLAQLLLFCVYQCFVLARWTHAVFLDPAATSNQRTGLQYVSCSYMVPLTMQVLTFFNYGKHHYLINRIFKHAKTFENRFTRLKRPRKCTSFMQKMYCVGPVVILLNTVALFRNPAAPHLTTSLLEDVKMRPKWQLAPFAIVHAYIWCTQWATMYFWAFVAMAYSTTLLNMLACLRDPELWQRDECALWPICMEIRKLQVLQNNFNSLHRWAAVSIEVVLMITCVFSFYGAVRIEGIRGLHLLLIGTVALSILVAIWTKLGEIYGESSKTLRKWKSMESPRWFRRFLMSTPPLKVEVGRFFYADRMMILTVVGIILQNTSNLLLTT